MTTDSARAAPRLLALSAALLMTFSACTDASGRADLDDGLYAEMQTSRGTITLQLEFERTPLTVANFVGLAEGNIAFSNRDADRFYDGLTFHRVIDDFMVQGGDPNGDGSGGPGYTFSDEIDPELVHDAPGILSMANAGPNTNGSQFFITHVPTPWLNGNHTVFGHVVTGQDVVDSIEQGDTIEKVTILRIGSAARAFVVDQERFDALAAEASGRGVRQAAQAREDAEAHIAQAWPEAQSSDSGLQWVVDQAGDGGGKPQPGDTATVHYTGKLLDGTVFDSSRTRGAPADLQVGRLIPGFEEALLDMTAGEQRTVIIPPELGYGSRGVPGAIPPNSFLVFELELISF